MLKISRDNKEDLKENSNIAAREQDKYEDKIENLLKKNERDRIIKIFLIIIIIILLLMFWLLYRLGKIGYEANKEVIANPSEEVLIKITQGDIDIDKNTSLGIFKNEKFGGNEIIAPNSSGSYQFYVKNESENDIIYHIRFVDEKNYFVNMKYRLKIDNIYIRGSKNSYVGIEELNVEDVTVLKGSNNIYTLEWYWQDSDEADTIVGSRKDTQYYTLNLKISASLYEKKE